LGHRSPKPAFELLDEFVAVARLFLEQAQNDELEVALLEESGRSAVRPAFVAFA